MLQKMESKCIHGMSFSIWFVSLLVLINSELKCISHDNFQDFSPKLAISLFLFS